MSVMIMHSLTYVLCLANACSRKTEGIYVIIHFENNYDAFWVRLNL